MEEILALRRQADELEREAQHAKGPGAAWLWARAQALRLEADARADWADVKAAAEFAAIGLENMATDFWNSPQMVFVRHTVETTVNTATAIGVDVVEHPIEFTWGFLSSTAEAMSWGLYEAPEPTNPDAAYYTGRVLGDSLAAAGGAAIAGAGLTAESGGFVLDATGVGAVAGVPLNVAGLAVAGAGAGVAVRATADLARDSQMMMAKASGEKGPAPTRALPGGTSKVDVDILSNKTLTNQTGKVNNYVSDKKGFDAAKEDFDALKPNNVRTYPNGTIVGDLPNGIT